MVTPYYDEDGITIYRGDCRAVLASLRVPVAAVITDPPYGETSIEWDRWPTGWVDAVAMAVPEAAPLWCFGSMRMFLERAEEFKAWAFAQDLVWEKHNGSSASADRFRRVHEHAVQWYRGPWQSVWRQPVMTSDATKQQVRRKERPKHWGEIAGSVYRSEDGGPRLARSVLYARSCHGDAVHPTQKPLGVVEPLIQYSVPVGGIVLDTFMGSGSTLVAAQALGRRAIGIEADERWCEVAVTRLGQRALPMVGSGGQG